MPNAREMNCKVAELKWLTPTVLGIRLQASKPVQFEPGQFVAVKVPNGPKRLYSFATPPRGLLDPREFELCVKYLQGGAASEYLSRLKIGDPVEIWGPYGDFTYETDSSRSVCFIATGTGIAPIRSIVLSEKFRNEPPRKATLLFGARDSTEIVYPGAFEEAGCRVIYALSQFKGPHTHGPMAEVYGRRLTDYLESLPKYSNWQNTDFYLCGNNEMIMDVTSILIQAFNVDSEAIRSEAFGASIQSLPINRVKRVA